MKKIVKRIAEVLGYELKRKDINDIFFIRQSFEEALRHIRSTGYLPDLIIDVGTAGGTPPLQNVFSDSIFFWIEPLKEFENALKGLRQKFNGRYIITGVGNTEGNFVINVHNDLHGSTMFNETDGNASDGEPREIPVTTLNKLCAEYNWKQFNKILLKVDVQGFEVEVLKGAHDVLANVDVIILEVSLFRFLKKSPDFFDVITYMKGLGYVVYDIVAGINRPLDSALGQKDLVFVKENGFFRKSHRWTKE